jgi:hypothetical protein
VYDDGTRTFWLANGYLFWMEAGPRGDSVAPTPTELAPAEGIANAFLVAALVAVAAGLIAVVALPRASRFLPKLRLSPQAMPMH